MTVVRRAIDVQAVNAGDTGPGETVLGEVGSYGYQLSRIIDAVQVIVDQLKKRRDVRRLSRLR